MALIEMFQGDPEVQKSAIRKVLDDGLLAAEGKGSATFSGSDDLRILLTRGETDRPEFLDCCSDEFQQIYDEWLAENRSRVDAVMGIESQFSLDGVEPAFSDQEVLTHSELINFKECYDRLPVEIKQRSEWLSIAKRLLANDGAELRRVKGLRGGGLFFGVDWDGKGLFKDVGTEPVIYARSIESGKLVRILDGNLGSYHEEGWDDFKWDDLLYPMGYPDVHKFVHRDGFELFPLRPLADQFRYKSDEIQQAESFTGKPFIASELFLEGKSNDFYRETYLETPGFDFDSVAGLTNPENRLSIMSGYALVSNEGLSLEIGISMPYRYISVNTMPGAMRLARV